MRHIRPFALGSGSIEPISPEILRSARGYMLRHFEQEARHGKGFGFSLEELVAGGVGDHRGLSVFFDAYLFQRKWWAGDVLGEGPSCLGGSGGDVHRGVDTESSLSMLWGNFLYLILPRPAYLGVIFSQLSF